MRGEDLARFLVIFRHVGPVAGQAAQHLWWQVPNAFRTRLHGAADIALALGQRGDELLPTDTQMHPIGTKS